VESSLEPTRFIVTDHSSRALTDSSVLGFQSSGKSERGRPLSNEPHGKQKHGHQETNLRNSLITLSHAQTGCSNFWFETNAKLEQRNHHGNERVEKRKKYT
jgi:hypothetical protein